MKNGRETLETAARGLTNNKNAANTSTSFSVAHAAKSSTHTRASISGVKRSLSVESSAAAPVGTAILPGGPPTARATNHESMSSSAAAVPPAAVPRLSILAQPKHVTKIDRTKVTAAASTTDASGAVKKPSMASMASAGAGAGALYRPHGAAAAAAGPRLSLSANQYAGVQSKVDSGRRGSISSTTGHSSSAAPTRRMSVSSASGGARLSLASVKGSGYGQHSSTVTSKAGNSASAASAAPATAESVATADGAAADGAVPDAAPLPAPVDKHLLSVIVSCVAEAQELMVQGHHEEARSALRDLTTSIPASKSKAMVWATFSQIEESVGNIGAAMDVLLGEAMDNCRRFPVEHTILSQAVGRLAKGLAGSMAASSSSISSVNAPATIAVEGTNAIEHVATVTTTASADAAGENQQQASPAVDAGEWVGVDIHISHSISGSGATLAPMAGSKDEQTDGEHPFEGIDIDLSEGSGAASDSKAINGLKYGGRTGSSNDDDAMLEAYIEAQEAAVVAEAVAANVAASAMKKKRRVSEGHSDVSAGVDGTTVSTFELNEPEMAQVSSSSSAALVESGSGANARDAAAVSVMSPGLVSPPRPAAFASASKLGRLSNDFLMPPPLNHSSSSRSWSGSLKAVTSDALATAASSSPTPAADVDSHDNDYGDGGYGGGNDHEEQNNAAATSSSEAAGDCASPQQSVDDNVNNRSYRRVLASSIKQERVKLPSPQMGSAIVLQAVESKPSTARNTGIATFLSPVRRSVRVYRDTLLAEALPPLPMPAEIPEADVGGIADPGMEAADAASSSVTSPVPASPPAVAPAAVAPASERRITRSLAKLAAKRGVLVPQSEGPAVRHSRRVPTSGAAGASTSLISSTDERVAASERKSGKSINHSSAAGPSVALRPLPKPLHMLDGADAGGSRKRSRAGSPSAASLNSSIASVANVAATLGRAASSAVKIQNPLVRSAIKMVMQHKRDAVAAGGFDSILAEAPALQESDEDIQAHTEVLDDEGAPVTLTFADNDGPEGDEVASESAAGTPAAARAAPASSMKSALATRAESVARRTRSTLKSASKAVAFAAADEDAGASAGADDEAAIGHDLEDGDGIGAGAVARMPRLSTASCDSAASGASTGSNVSIGLGLTDMGIPVAVNRSDRRATRAVLNELEDAGVPSPLREEVGTGGVSVRFTRVIRCSSGGTV